MNTDNEYGYHTYDIPKGKLGEFSKIKEEFLEFEDAYCQKDIVMEICELSDLLGAISHYLKNRTNGSVTLNDLISFNEKTENAFKNGKR